MGIVRETLTGSPSHKVDYDALSMEQQTDDALTANRNHSTRFGYWASEVVLMHENTDVLDAAAKALSGYVEQSGFR